MEKVFNRDLYNRSVSIKSLKDKEEEEDKVVGGSGQKKEFLQLKEGLNKIRLALHHEDEDFYRMRCVHKIKSVNDDGDLRTTMVLNARIHGGQKKDIIEEYIAFVKSKLDANDSEDTEKIKAITDWKSGLLPQYSWWSYGFLLTDEGHKGGIYDFGKSVRGQISDAIAAEEAEDTIEVDPFTHPDEGRPILHTKDKSAKNNSDKNKIKLAKKAVALTDEDLMWLFEQPSLASLLVNVYDADQFKRAIEGIKIFDQEYQIDLFEEDAFQEIVEELQKAIEKTSPSKKVQETSKEVKKTTSSKKEEKARVEEDDEEVEKPVSKKKTDIFDDMDREELKEYMAENFDEGTFSIKKSMSDDDLRNMIRKEKENVEEAGSDNEDEEVVTKQKVVAKSEEKPKGKMTAQELKEKFSKK